MSFWKQYAKPVVVLLSICTIMGFGLALANAVTAPIIAENETKATQQALQALLPQAKSFESIAVTDENGEPKYEGVTAMYKAEGMDAYVVSAAFKGYGGLVPVMVAFDEKGQISAVSFLSNGETPGLGQKVRGEKFQKQFAGLPAEPVDGTVVDTVAGATFSSNAALQGVNAAVAAYKAEAKGEVAEAVPQTEDEILAYVLPDAGALTAVEVPTSIDAMYTGENYGTILVCTVEGFYKKDVTAYVGFDDDGVITGVYINAATQTEGIGRQVDGIDFAKQFKGQSGSITVDAIAGATVSSQAAGDAVKAAVAAYETIKGAA